MENRPAGSFIEDKDGNLTPNLTDEAMKTRQGLEGAGPAPLQAPNDPKPKPQKKEDITND